MPQKNKFLFLLIILFPFITFGQCPVGNVVLNTQNDVEEFIQNYNTCEIINGDLLIGDEVSDISGITGIKRVEGSLKVKYADVPGVSNFASLNYVGGDFEIHNCRSLQSVEGINNLHTIKGGLFIRQTSAIFKTISGFEELETIGGNFYINENYNGLEKIEAFEKLAQVDGAFVIQNNDSLKRVTGFNSLIKIGVQYSVESFDGNLSIRNNASLIEINGFNSLLEVVRDISILDNRSLNKIAGFSNLSLVNRHFEIDRNPELAVIPAFDNLKTVGSGLSLIDNGFTRIDSFNNLEVIGNLDPSWGNLYIGRNDQLTAISGFRNLQKLFGELGITRHKKLTNLIGFSNLKATRSLNIQMNESLENLNGLENLLSIGEIGIAIRSNPVLSDCSAICNILTNGTVDGDISIVDNPSACSSVQEVRGECIPDFDNDEVPDDIDLDDDNDGILDTVEQNGDPNRDSDGDDFPDHMDLDSDNDGCYDVTEAGFLDENQDGTLGDSPVEVDENGLVINTGDGYTTPLDSDNNGIPDFQEWNTLSAGENGNISICNINEPIDLFKELTGNPDEGGIWNPTLESGNSIFDATKDAPGSYTYIVKNGICGEDSAMVTIEIEEKNNAGENTSVEVCSQDAPFNLFSKINGNPMEGGTLSPPLASGTEIFDPFLDSARIYTYTVSNNSCEPESSEIVVNIGETPSAGEIGALTIGIHSNPVNLFDSLGGNPDPGGVWKPELSNADGIFNPSLDNEGIYTYTVENTICGITSSQIHVNLNTLPNAGNNATLEICKDVAPINLLELMSGSPDEGGNWYPELSGNLFDPQVDSAGTYVYTVTNDNDQTDSSEVTISIIPGPNAGENGNLEICKNADAVDLFNSLRGNPQINGKWTPSLSSGNGVFNPAIDPEGVYSYEVSNTCGTSVAHVSVTKTDFQPIEDYEIRVEEFSKNNFIEVIINSNLTFEYSLDGSAFQNSPVFENLTGGTHSLTARQIGGCDILQKLITILDYPKFFTPNNDGYNDFWQLKGNTGPRISYINIYDRYGKLLISIDPQGKGWDGTFDGKIMPENDYWFEISTVNNELKTGHFTLIR
ncbi:T9SS type B sorting domain-containing protein [Salegentibacter salegens]|uniref:Gliding motility-associated C-terminal domain-containing protein n=1 Tax=Salegentibacter salegens TaxID=143223 RepID=A0A1M7MF33_9FLAO|nr:T9SS type B sorting domain-containing protein [Salegentibacter salegens]PRX48094.1 gliding motility-associated-like protein [Salegentibacter salegens]SHM89457.1 gliding motility-associated C-terminal domain-containing protein [Salegentibacter salegens]